jgi:hypothetical protein
MRTGRVSRPGGEQMRVFFSLLLVLVLVTMLSAATPQAGETLRVKVGTNAKAAKSGLNIEFVELLDDSRCPKGATCIWAGEGKIKLSITKPGRKGQSFELVTTEGNNSVSYAGYELRLIELTPQPAVNVRIDRTKYAATFVIGKSGKS